MGKKDPITPIQREILTSAGHNPAEIENLTREGASWLIAKFYRQNPERLLQARQTSVENVTRTTLQKRLEDIEKKRLGVGMLVQAHLTGGASGKHVSVRRIVGITMDYYILVEGRTRPITPFQISPV